MVFKRLFGLNKEAPPRVWRAPNGQRLYAIGDIHGRRDLLDRLLGLIDEDDATRPQAESQLIFLGDLIDRGDDSCGVVERLMSLAASSPNVRFLKGNHEELLIRVCEGDSRAAGLFHRVGGRETMLSYGMSEAEYDALDLSELAAEVPRHIPLAHLEFLKNFDDWIEAGDYLFVHAGVRPGLALEDQETSDLRWIRREFTQHEGLFSHMVVHGHTISESVDERPNRIGIDTGAFATGTLTAIGIENSERWFLST
jgi:serine/threonine protein phosphatase 1